MCQGPIPAAIRVMMCVSTCVHALLFSLDSHDSYKRSCHVGLITAFWRTGCF